MPTDTWSARALPLLEVIAEREGRNSVEIRDLAESVGCTVEQAEIELSRLMRDEYLGGQIEQSGYSSGGLYIAPQLAERGARTIGLWPRDDPYDVLIALLEERLASDELDSTTRSKLARLRDTLVDVGKGAAGGVLAALMRAGIGF